MAAWTVAQLREREVKRLASLKNPDPTEEDINEARRNMNSFYRLCGLSETNLYLTNDERTHDKPSTKKSEERETKWHKRLDKVFKDTYGLRLVYIGYNPSIGELDELNRFSEKISRYFYN